MLFRLTAGLYLRQVRQFWRLRARMADFRVRAFSRVYGVRQRAGAEAESASSLLQIARSTIYDVVLAVLIATAVWYANPLLAKYPRQLTPASYTDLLGIIAGVGGVFIGLYYTALTAAISSVYVATPHNLREVVVREQYGSAYMRFLGVVTFLALILLGLDAYGLSTSASGPPVMVAFSGIAVVGFITLRTWAFNLFDPTSVQTTIQRELHLLIQQVTMGGYQWQNPAFQQFAQRLATRVLATLKTLADVCEGQGHLNEGPLLRVSYVALRLAARAFVAAERIPSTSRWFPDRYVHPNWYRTDDSHVEIASFTGTMLQPTVTRDGWWVEDACEKIALAACGRSSLGNAKTWRRRSCPTFTATAICWQNAGQLNVP